MTTFQIDWSVTSIANGNGEGVRDGDRTVVGEGHVTKDAEDPQELRSQLLTLLKQQWPEHQLRSTYDLNHIYQIDIAPIRADVAPH